MFRTKTIHLLALAISLVLYMGRPAFSQSSNPAWLDDLEGELLLDKDCQVIEYLDMHEGKLGGRNTYFAKVKCQDGREYDASRIEPEEEFTIRLCEIVTC